MGRARGLTLVATAAVSILLATKTDSPAPIADASVLTLSLAATWGPAQRLLESWLIVDDGVRDGEHIREWMTAVFAERLAGRQWRWLRGGREQRLERAIELIDSTFRGRRFADPLG